MGDSSSLSTLASYWNWVVSLIQTRIAAWGFEFSMFDVVIAVELSVLAAYLMVGIIHLIEDKYLGD